VTEGGEKLVSNGVTYFMDNPIGSHMIAL